MKKIHVNQPRKRRSDKERAEIYASHDYAVHVAYNQSVMEYLTDYRPVCTCPDQQCQKMFRDEDRYA